MSSGGIKIENREDAVAMLNYLNREGHVEITSRLGMVEYAVKTPDAKSTSEIGEHSFVRIAKQAIGILLDKPAVPGFEGGSGDDQRWFTKLKRDEAKTLMDAGVEVSDPILAKSIASKVGGMARGMASGSKADSE